MLSKPTGPGAPPTAAEGMREMAKMFDLYDKELLPLLAKYAELVDSPVKKELRDLAMTIGNSCQVDLRRWADELEELGGR